MHSNHIGINEARLSYKVGQKSYVLSRCLPQKKTATRTTSLEILA